MDMITIIFIALALAMDAFAVSLANGMVIRRVRLSHSLKFGAYFGVFQFVMPCIGWFLGSRFAVYIESIDHWIAFILLAFIGGRMIRETFGSEDCEAKSEAAICCPSNMVLLAIATSIDAMAVGVGLAVIDTDILSAAVIIGVVAFVLSACGVFLGKQLGSAFGKQVERLGGVILIGIGFKILIEHLFMQ